MRGSPRGYRAESPERPVRVEMKRLGHVEEFHDIKPALAALIFGDEGLHARQFSGEFRLADAGGAARFDEQPLEALVSRREYGLGHAGIVKPERGLAQNRLESAASVIDSRFLSEILVVPAIHDFVFFIQAPEIP